LQGGEFSRKEHLAKEQQPPVPVGRLTSSWGRERRKEKKMKCTNGDRGKYEQKKVPYTFLGGMMKKFGLKSLNKS